MWDDLVMKRKRIYLLICVLVVAAVLLTLYFPVRDARRAAIASSTEGQLNYLQLSLQHYHAEHGHFPPAYLADENGVPMHSWRVLILPYIEENELYAAYNFGEPWNGPNNIQLADRMPNIFCMQSEPKSTRFTNIVAITGPGTAFPGSETTSIDQFADGTENTLLLTEVSDSRLCWLEPRDLTVEGLARGPLQDGVLSMSAVEWRDPFVVFADHIAAYSVASHAPIDLLRALATVAGDEEITKADLIERGYLK